MNQVILQSSNYLYFDNEYFEEEIGKYILGGNGISSKERMGIYINGYKARLLECLQADYPYLNKFLGNDLFGYFALSYLREYPPKSYSLFDLGNNFSEYLDKTKPNTSSVSLFPVELAKLERVRVEVQRSFGTEGVDQKPPFSAFSFSFFDEKEIYCASPCLRLLSSNFDLTGFLDRIEREDQPVLPDFTKTKIAVCRNNFRINFQRIEEWQYCFLKSFEENSQSIGQAIKIVAENTGHLPSKIMAELMLWIPFAFDMGYLVVKS